MDYTITINIFYLTGIVIFGVIFYIYANDDGDDRLTQMRHNVEMKKEWFRMLAEQNKQKVKNSRRA